VNVCGFQPGGAWVGVKSKTERKALRVGWDHLASVQVEEDAHATLTGVDTLHPAVERLVEVIEVVLSEAVALGAGAGSVVISHALKPAVVLA